MNACACNTDCDRWQHGRLCVADDRRGLAHEDGTPFFWLGDTAWELFHRLTPAETSRYLENRAGKGFSVIQAVLLAEWGGVSEPTPQGHLPLVDQDPGRPDVRDPGNNYWTHVDWVLDRAHELGLAMALLPMWGDYVTAAYKSSWPQIFTPANGAAYGAWLADRYRDRTNVIWVMGGDCLGPDVAHVYVPMAEAIKARAPDQLMTFHPRGHRSSSEWFHATDWLDFNMAQSGHCEMEASFEAYRYLEHDRALAPVKPALDGEPCYEAIPRNLDNEARAGYWSADDVRRKAYWTLFAGACGFTYGHNWIWQMRKAGDPIRFADKGTWEDGLDAPGSFQLAHVKRLFCARPVPGRVPAQELVVSVVEGKREHVRALRGAGHAFIYTPTGAGFRVDLGALGWSNVRTWWYDPRTGRTRALETCPGEGQAAFEPPGARGWGCDWVLGLDDAACGYPVL